MNKERDERKKSVESEIVAVSILVSWQNRYFVKEDVTMYEQIMCYESTTYTRTNLTFYCHWNFPLLNTTTSMRALRVLLSEYFLPQLSTQ